MISSLQTDSWLSIIFRGGFFAFLWLIITAGATNSWIVGGPVVILAVVVSRALLPVKLCIWHEFFIFVPFFLYRSLLGGADVAWRAFHPVMPIVPELVEYPIRLPSGLPQVFMANTISLLPGTLSATLDQGVVRVHVLDSRSDFLAELNAVEQRVARLFGVSLDFS